MLLILFKDGWAAIAVADESSLLTAIREVLCT
jgi:hypothetical protein